MNRVAPPATADLGWLEPGTHLCAFPRDERQMTRIATTFVDQGLSAGDQLLYVASDEQADALLATLPVHVRAREALASGQLQVTSFAEAYGTERPTDLGTIAEGFRAAAADSRKQGFPALRVAARMDLLEQLLGSREAVIEWERMSTGVQHELGVSSVCLYSRGAIDDQHAARIAAEHAGFSPEIAETPMASFLAVDKPWGLRVSGEVDISNGELLQRLLLSRAAVVPRLHLDLEGLTFADVGTLSRLRSVAAGLPATGSLTLEGAPGFVRRTLDICGLGHERLVVAP
jgi:anti-anti-sigma regulatory factor